MQPFYFGPILSHFDPKTPEQDFFSKNITLKNKEFFAA